ncbi:hypothetical protein MKP09_10090 [Niabella ginsengisoli]|uniref:histidine kinase n=1 Tax=Niabella ginsengisoli TaxID=522298 RepID=A0ABS9SIP2_9BACT|nr:hypothetical protein [Niabella ginsengisoli]
METSFPSAGFAKLAPGKYELTVYAITGNNVASPQKKLLIIVQAPWWLTWWAYCIYILAAITAFYIIYRIAKRENKLKRDLAIAEKEKELNQRKLEFFTNISHELRTPMTQYTVH